MGIHGRECYLALLLLFYDETAILGSFSDTWICITLREGVVARKRHALVCQLITQNNTNEDEPRSVLSKHRRQKETIGESSRMRRARVRNRGEALRSLEAVLGAEATPLIQREKMSRT